MVNTVLWFFSGVVMFRYCGGVHGFWWDYCDGGVQCVSIYEGAVGSGVCVLPDCILVGQPIVDKVMFLSVVDG